MTQSQHNRLIQHARSLMADAKWLKTATPEAYRWAAWWAAMEPLQAVFGDDWQAGHKRVKAWAQRTR